MFNQVKKHFPVNRELIHNAPREEETPEEVQDAREQDQLCWLQIMDEEDAKLLNSDNDDKEELDETSTV
jgi:hypothetical protein